MNVEELIVVGWVTLSACLAVVGNHWVAKSLGYGDERKENYK